MTKIAVLEFKGLNKNEEDYFEKILNKLSNSEFKHRFWREDFKSREDFFDNVTSLTQRSHKGELYTEYSGHLAANLILAGCEQEVDTIGKKQWKIIDLFSVGTNEYFILPKPMFVGVKACKTSKLYKICPEEKGYFTKLLRFLGIYAPEQNPNQQPQLPNSAPKL